MKNFIAMTERQFNKQVKIIGSDNGTEFMCLKNYFLEHKIIFQTSCTRTPQQNGRVERKHQHILNVARALRFQGHLPIDFWGECVLTAAYLINRTPSTILNGKTPYEALYGHPPSYEHLRVFGSLCYAHNQGTKGDKFASRSRRCVFVGYPYGKKGWSLYDLETQTFFISRDVVFSEHEFPFDPNQIRQHNFNEINASECVEVLDRMEERGGMGVQAHSPFEEGKGDEAQKNEAQTPQPRWNEEGHGVGQPNQDQTEEVERAQHSRHKEGATEAPGS